MLMRTAVFAFVASLGFACTGAPAALQITLRGDGFRDSGSALRTVSSRPREAVSR